MDLDRIRKLAGLPSDSVLAPSQLSDVITESTKLDFSEKVASNLSNLEDAISENVGINVTLSEDAKEANDDLIELGLNRVGSVVDLGKTVYVVYEDVEQNLWFRHTDASGNIQETTLTMEDLKTFHNGNDVVMREAAKKPDADGDGVPDWADKKHGKDDNKCECECGCDDGCKCKCDDDCSDCKCKPKSIKESDGDDRGMSDQDHADSKKAGERYVAELRERLKRCKEGSEDYTKLKQKLDKAEDEEQS